MPGAGGDGDSVESRRYRCVMQIAMTALLMRCCKGKRGSSGNNFIIITDADDKMALMTILIVCQI